MLLTRANYISMHCLMRKGEKKCILYFYSVYNLINLTIQH